MKKVGFPGVIFKSMKKYDFNNSTFGAPFFDKTKYPGKW